MVENTQTKKEEVGQQLFLKGHIIESFKWFESKIAEQSGSEAILLKLDYAKLLLQVGKLTEAKAQIESTFAPELVLDKQVKAKAHYIMGKILYAENQYARAMREYEKITSEDGISKKRVAKTWLNMALVKCMSSNHKQALAICEKAVPYIEDSNKLLRFKYLIKKATLLKKSSWFKESFELLQKLEKEICEYIE